MTLRKRHNCVPEPIRLYTGLVRSQLTILAIFPHFRSCCTAKGWVTLSMEMLLTCITRSFSLPNSTKTCNQIISEQTEDTRLGLTLAPVWEASLMFLMFENRKRGKKTYNSKPSAGPPCRTSDTMMDVSPLSMLGLSLPPDTAIPNPILESWETERIYEKETALQFKALLMSLALIKS